MCARDRWIRGDLMRWYWPWHKLKKTLWSGRSDTGKSRGGGGAAASHTRHQASTLAHPGLRTTPFTGIVAEKKILLLLFLLLQIYKASVSLRLGCLLLWCYWPWRSWSTKLSLPLENLLLFLLLLRFGCQLQTLVILHLAVVIVFVVCFCQLYLLLYFLFFSKDYVFL